MADKKMINRIRPAIQGVALLIQNANIKGFFSGEIYQGPVKSVCVPGLNCYSCPGAVGACPIGSLQSSLSAYRFRFPYYVLGLLIFFGAVLGRGVCGFLCPLGFLQDILHKIPFPKKIKTFKGDRTLRKLKYVVLILMVVVIPVSIKLTPAFCEYLCPAGSVSALFLMIGNSSLFEIVGRLFTWKMTVLAILALLSVIIYRPFCRYLCPLGAFYAPFNKISVLQLRCDGDSCVGCKACANVCEMTVDPSESPDNTECIRCGKCVAACPAEALSYSSVFRSGGKNAEDLNDSHAEADETDQI